MHINADVAASSGLHLCAIGFSTLLASWVDLHLRGIWTLVPVRK
jgi:hypothetical protein